MTTAHSALSLAIGVFLVCALSGCTLIPAYERPALPVPAAYPDTGGNTAVRTGAAGAASADIAARDLFRDERLNRLIELALANNRDLRTAVLNVQQTQAQYRIVRSALFPQVQGTAGATRSETSFGSATPLPGTVTGANGSAAAASYRQQLQREYRGHLVRA